MQQINSNHIQKPIGLNLSGGLVIAILWDGVLIVDVKGGDSYVSATVEGGLRFYSCYAPSSLSSVGLVMLLGNIKASAAEHHGTGVDVIVTCDFNTHAAAWGMLVRTRGGNPVCIGRLHRATLSGNRPLAYGEWVVHRRDLGV